jgi:hypothetical protein
MNKSNKKSAFEDIAFPIIRNVQAQLLGPQIATLEEMGLTEKQIINGRTVKPYPEKYDDFDSVGSLREYISNEIHTNSELKWEWLRAGKYSTMRFQKRDDVYYTPVLSIGVSCMEPRDPKDWGCVHVGKGKELLRLNPNKWPLAFIEEMIEQLQIDNEK